MRLITTSLLLPIIYAQQLSGVLNGITSIVPASGAAFDDPRSTWDVTMTYNPLSYWRVDDTFTLNMQCVYSAPSFTMYFANTEAFAECNVYSGESIVPYSQLNCKLVSVMDYPQTFSTTFQVSFDAGINPECAQLFSNPSSTEITFIDGNNIMKKEVTAFGNKLKTIDSKDEFVINTRYNSQLNANELLFMSPVCPNGFESISISIAVNTFFDQSTIFGGYSDNFNSYFYPINYTSTIPAYEKTLTDVYSYTFNQVSAGSFPFVSIRLEGISTLQIQYASYYQCQDGKLVDNQFIQRVKQPNVTYNRIDAIVSTETWSGTETSVSTLPIAGGYKTIVVLVPTPTEIVTYSGLSAYTITPTGSGATTVQIYVPTPVQTETITIFSLTETSATTIYATAEGETDVVQLYVPIPTVTVTSEWSQYFTYSVVWPATAAGQTGEVDVYVPQLTLDGDIIESSGGSNTFHAIPMSSEGNNLNNPGATLSTNTHNTPYLSDISNNLSTSIINEFLISNKTETRVTDYSINDEPRVISTTSSLEDIISVSTEFPNNPIQTDGIVDDDEGVAHGDAVKLTGYTLKYVFLFFVTNFIFF